MSRLQSVEKTQLPLSGNWVSITYTTENRQVLRTPLLLQCVTEMCDGAGSDAEYAGMAVHRAHGGRGGPAARTVVCPRPGLSFQMHTPDWFRQFVNPFPTPHGSAASCISCGIFWSMCRRKRRNPSDDPYKTVDEVDIRSVESNCTKWIRILLNLHGDMGTPL